MESPTLDSFEKTCGPGEMHGLTITGTDTNVGKTYVTARLVERIRADGICCGAYKPVCSGSRRVDTAPGRTESVKTELWDDIEILHHAMRAEFPRELICPQKFSAPLAPPRAAQAQGMRVSEPQLLAGLDRWKEHVPALVIEGAGGLLAPISDSWTFLDFAAQAAFPLVIVAHAGLGTINHTLLTVEVARQRGLQILGVILNQVHPVADDPSLRTNREDIERWGNVEVLAELPHQPPRPIELGGGRNKNPIPQTAGNKSGFDWLPFLKDL